MVAASCDAEMDVGNTAFPAFCFLTHLKRCNRHVVRWTLDIAALFLQTVKGGPTKLPVLNPVRPQCTTDVTL